MRVDVAAAGAVLGFAWGSDERATAGFPIPDGAALDLGDAQAGFQFPAVRRPPWALRIPFGCHFELLT